MLAALASKDAFDALVVAHVVCAIVGFGSLLLSGVYGLSNRAPAGADDLEEARRYFGSPAYLELLVIAVPFLGGAALAVQPHGRGVVQLWTLLASCVWAVATVVLFAVVRPAERRLRVALAVPAAAGDAAADPALAAAGDPAVSGAGAVDIAAVGAAAGRLGWAGVTTDVAFAVALFLMILQPR